MRSLITAVSGKLRSILGGFSSVRQRPIILLFVGALGFVANDAAQMALDKVKYQFFPELDDTAYLVKEQARSFAEVNSNLDALESRLTGEDRELAKTLRTALTAASQNSEAAVARVSQLTEENEKLRDALKPGASKGNEDIQSELNPVATSVGNDFAIKEGGTYKLDSMNHLGFLSAEVGSNSGRFALSSLMGDGMRGWLSVGESMKYTGASGESCYVVFSGLEKKAENEIVGNFTWNCKKQ